MNVAVFGGKKCFFPEKHSKSHYIWPPEINNPIPSSKFYKYVNLRLDPNNILLGWILFIFSGGYKVETTVVKTKIELIFRFPGILNIYQ